MFARRTEWQLEPNALSREAECRRQRGLPLLDLTESNPTRCGFVYDFAAIAAALAQPGILTYAPEPRGLLAARQAVARYYAEHGVNIDPEQIFLVASTSEAYSHLFRLLADPGDVVLVPSPSYPLFEFLAGLNDVERVTYPLVYDSGWRIDRDELAAIVERTSRGPHPARALVVVHPNNPTGSFVDPGERETLVALCRRFGLALIADEVFADYGLEGYGTDGAAPHAGLDSVLTFTLSGLSKIAALPQMKLAWIVAGGPPDALAAAMARLEIIADTYLSVSAPVAGALAELLATRRAIQPQICAQLRENLAELDRLLDSEPGVVRLETEGGWYAILELSPARDGGEGSSSEDWAVRLVREEGVLVHPGHFYDLAGDRHLVLSLLPPTDVFSEGVGKLLARTRTHGRAFG